MKIAIDPKGLDQTTRAVMNLPGLFARARISAMKSTGWTVQQELRNHVEYGGEGWPELHPLTQAFRKKRGLGADWVKRKRGAHQSALFWLGKFARYRVNDDGTLLQVDFGKSRKGKPGTFDPALIGTVKRAEQGERIEVTDKMRRLLGATRRRRPRNQEPGVTFFPLRKTTRFLDVPARPIFDPVWRKIKNRIPGHFEEKFWKALERYEKGGTKT